MILHPTQEFDLKGQTVIVPVVSTANISQLAVDLLIASLSLRRIGIFDPINVIPIAGAREDGEAGITTSLELYGRKGVDVVIVHQRSPTLKSRKTEYIDGLFTFLNDSQFAAVLFVSGVDMSNRTDAQMLNPAYYLQSPNTPDLKATPLAGLAQLPVYTSPVSQRPYDSGKDSEAIIPFIPGGGLTRRILSSVPQTWPVPAASLLQFVLEGDNRADAGMLAALVVKILGLDAQVKEWKQPSSWRQGLFGTPHDQTLYG